MKAIDTMRALMRARQRVLYVDSPAKAKTARILSAAESEGFAVVGITAGTADRVDFGGALIPDVKRGITRALPLETLDTLLNAKAPTLAFFDDLANGEIDVQAAIKSLITRGGKLYGNPNILVWGATNRPGDKTGVRALHESLRSEFHLAYAMPQPPKFDDAGKPSNVEDKADGAVVLGTWQEEVDSWCEWALDRSSPADPAIVAYHRSTTGSDLYQWQPSADPARRFPDYRSWETVIALRNVGIKDLATTAAAIGKPTAAKFTAFEALADNLPTPDQVRMDPKGSPVPREPAALYFVSTMLGASATEKDAAPFITYFSRMPRTFAALTARDMYRRIGAKLSGTKEWTKWFVENQALFV